MNEAKSQTKSDATSKLLAVLVVVLLAAVCVQGVLLFKVYAKPSEDAKVKSSGRVDVAPAQIPVKPDPTPTSIDPLDPWWNTFNNWDPVAEIQQMHERMNRLLDESFNRFRMAPGFAERWSAPAFSPRLDLRETADQYVVRMDIPGADKAKLSVNIEDRTLTVSGQVDEVAESQDAQMLRRERRSGSFQRSVMLPGPVQSDAMTAKYENGILTITVPKKKDAGESRRITIL